MNNINFMKCLAFLIFLLSLFFIKNSYCQGDRWKLIAENNEYYIYYDSETSIYDSYFDKYTTFLKHTPKSNSGKDENIKYIIYMVEIRCTPRWLRYDSGKTYYYDGSSDSFAVNYVEEAYPDSFAEIMIRLFCR